MLNDEHEGFKASIVSADNSADKRIRCEVSPLV